MQLNAAQMQALQDGAKLEFEDRLVAHCHSYFPDQCCALGADGTREMVREAIARAGHHGFKIERHVSKFVDLFFTFGEGFDTDPALEWAQAILSDTTIASPAERIERLCDEALEHLERF